MLAGGAGQPPPGEPDGPLVRVLSDPAGALRRAAATALDVMGAALPHLAGAGLALAAAAAVLVAFRRRQRARMAGGARVVTILAPPEVEAGGGEALWRNLHDLLRPRWRRLVSGQPHLGFEYAWSTSGLRIGVWVPGVVPPGMVERAVEAAWPAARTETRFVAPAREGEAGSREAGRGEEAAEALLPEGWEAAGGSLRLAAPGWFPLRADFDADPLRAVLGAASAGGAGEAAAVQVLARPAGGRAVARCRKAAREVRAGRAPRRVLRLLDLISPGAPRRPVADPSAGADVRAILAKADSPLWEVAVRYAVAAQPSASKDARPALRGRAHALASAFALYAGRNRLVRRRLHRPAACLVARSFGRGDLLSVPELASLAHLPLDRIVPSLSRAGARPVSPPAGVGRDERAGKVLGDADAGGARPVVLAPADARYHLHLMGATGSGKSTLLTHLILDDVAAGRGAVVIDPKGDLVADVLSRLCPAERGRVVLLDPQVAEGRPTLNMLEVPEGVGNDLVVDHLVGIFGRIFERHWGHASKTCCARRASPCSSGAAPPCPTSPDCWPIPAPMPSSSVPAPTRSCGDSGSGTRRSGRASGPRSSARCCTSCGPSCCDPSCARSSTRRCPAWTWAACSTAACCWCECPRACWARTPPASSAASWWPRCGRPPPAGPPSARTPGSTPACTWTSARTS
ncbi:MAG: type IV secretion system DNA-binding domain-containing protein [Acidimicrobiia bacterium]